MTGSRWVPEDVRSKLALLRLAEQLGNVGEACRLMGYSRGSFYRIRARYLASGEDGLRRITRQRRDPPNRFDPAIEQRVVECSLANPRWGRRRVVEALAAMGISISASGVRCVWKRHGLLTARQRARGPAKVGEDLEKRGRMSFDHSPQR